MAVITQNLSKTTVLRNVEIPDVSLYAEGPRFIRFGFHPFLGGFFESWKDAKTQRVYNSRVSRIPLQEAENLATRISDTFATSVTVIKTLKIDTSTLAELEEIDPQSHERKLRVSVDPERIWAPYSMHIADDTRARQIVTFLSEHFHMSPEDNAIVTPLIEKIEAQGKLATTLTSHITPGQKTILRKICKPHIDQIIKACQGVGTRKKLFGHVTWLGIDKFDSQRDLAFAILVDSCQKNPVDLFYDLVAGLQAQCYAAADALQKIYEGRAALEAKMMSKESPGVPVLSEQRRVMFESFEARLSEVFEEEQAFQTKEASQIFLNALRKQLFMEGYTLDMISLKKLATDFKEDPKAEDLLDKETPLTIESDEGKREIPACKGRALVIDPYAAVLDALRSDFGQKDPKGTFHPKHIWVCRGKSLEGAKAQQKFALMTQQIRTILLTSSPSFSSPHTSKHHFTFMK